MNPELLSMLTAHGIDPVKPFGGIPKITQMDVAAMMAKLSPCESALLRAKYCGEPPHQAWAFWFAHLMNQRWETEQSGQIETLALHTFGECVYPQHCSRCKGTGSIVDDSKSITCEACFGVGYRPFSERVLSRRLKVGNSLPDEWLERLGWSRRELVKWEIGALRKISG